IWLVVAVGFAVRVRSPGGVALVDGEVSACVGDRVVIQNTGRRKCCGDVVRTSGNSFTGNSSVVCRHVIDGYEVRPAAGGQWIWLGISISFIIRVRVPCGIALVDGEAVARIRDVIVVQSSRNSRV